MIALWRRMLLAQWRAQPLRMLATLLAIAVGVALSAAVVRECRRARRVRPGEAPSRARRT
ncbi:MAG: hypothetical protein U1F11_03000 [Steroidobacteraceae bacterium]